jgi:hypothetical protein
MAKDLKVRSFAALRVTGLRVRVMKLRWRNALKVRPFAALRVSMKKKVNK